MGKTSARTASTPQAVELREYNDFWAELEREAAQPVLFSSFDGRKIDPKKAAKAANATFEERYDTLMEVVNKNPRHREILVKTLRACESARDFADIEEEIAGFTEYEHAGQNPYRFITYLIDGGGLDLLEVNADGALVTEEDKEGLTPNEVDDLIAGFRLQATDVGRAVEEELNPKRRIRELFGAFQDRKPYYIDLLQFCSEPRKFKEIEALFKGVDFSAVKTLHPESGLAIKPTVLVDNLEKSGAIVWKDGWKTTKEGSEFLAELLENLDR